MTPNTSRHVSPWADTMATPPGSTDVRDAQAADVLVAGAGIVGMTSAILLQESGLEVAVLEPRGLSRSVTAHSTVKVSVGHGLTYSRISRTRGRAAAAAYAHANVAGMARLRRLVEELDIDCDLRWGQRHLIYAEQDDEVASVQGELSMAQQLGLPAVAVEDAGLPVPVAAALAFEDQATFHPGRYLHGLASTFLARGGTLVTGVGLTGVAEHEKACTVSTTGGPLTASRVVVATGYPVLDRGGHFARLTATRSYGVAGVLPATSDDPGMTINVGSPTHSTRTVELDGERLLVVVGEGHEVGHVTDTDERWQRLRAWAWQAFGVEDFRYHWSAEETRSDDLLPFAGLANPGARRVYTATGFAGWGMTNGTAAAALVRDLVTGREPPSWAPTFDARRAATALPGKQFLTRNLHVARTWATDRLCTAPPADGIARLGPGEGAVFSVDGEDTAVSRDDAGGLHAVSAVCTHLGCNVAWNRGERSWDCPCHGSRFSPDGDVLHGPASSPLDERTVGDGTGSPGTMAR